ncbi:MAG: 6-phosphofructokinase [Thermoplasmatota archaeon]
MTNAQRTVAILVGGGPAPGINAVIASATRAALARGWRVLGVTRGFSRLIARDATAAKELHERDVAGIETRGGSVLLTSRANPVKKPGDLAAVAETLRGLGVTDLLSIGGEDTASSAAKVGDAMADADSAHARTSVRVAHVPKTIDNDLPLPEGVPTFGFDTARHLGGMLCRNLAEDARTTGRWYLVTGMGRTAGHLALAMGAASGADLVLVPEEFPKGTTLAEIALYTEAAVA